MTDIKEMTYEQAINITIPSEVIHRGMRRIITYRNREEAHEDNWHEYPATVLIVLSDGTVWRSCEGETMIQVDVTQYEQELI